MGTAYDIIDTFRELPNDTLEECQEKIKLSNDIKSELGFAMAENAKLNEDYKVKDDEVVTNVKLTARKIVKAIRKAQNKFADSVEDSKNLHILEEIVNLTYILLTEHLKI